MHIDWWTLGIQTVNIAILVWLLQRFFWRPVATMIEQRRVLAAAALDSARATDAKATLALAEMQKSRAGFAAERDEILKLARDATSLATAASLADAALRAAALEAAGTAAIASERRDSETAWAAGAASLAVDIAGRLAARLDGAAVQASFLCWLLQQLRALPDATRRTADGAALEAVTAAGLDADSQARTTGLIAKALGATPRLTYRTDPALIAGIELYGPHLAVTNSWRADLASILSEAGHDDGR